MELPEIIPGEESSDTVESEGSSHEAPPQNAEEFAERVARLCVMMQDDPTVRDRIIAEIYVNIASAEMGIRGVVEAVQSQGVAGLMRGAFRKG